MLNYERYPDWTARWAHFIKDSLDLGPDLALDWKYVSCTSFAGQGIEAITGHNPFEEEGWADKFDSPIAAAREIKARGYSTLDDVISSLFVEIPLAFAWPGDVVLVKTLAVDDVNAHRIMPHGVALAEPPYYCCPGIGGFGRGNLLMESVKAFAVGHEVKLV